MQPAAISEEELLNRITAIRAAAEILDDYWELAAADRHAFLKVIRNEALQLQRLVRTMTI